jgi:hypothetical protein
MTAAETDRRVVTSLSATKLIVPELNTDQPISVEGRSTMQRF